MKQSYVLISFIMTLPLYASREIQSPQLNTQRIQRHQTSIGRAVRTKSMIKHVLSTTTVCAVTYVAYISIFGNEPPKVKTTQPTTETDNIKLLQNIADSLSLIASIEQAANPIGKKLKHWLWNTEDARTTLRSFLLSTSIATITARLGIFELYKELLGKCSPYDSVTLFLEEKTRIKKLLKSFSYYAHSFSQKDVSESDYRYYTSLLHTTWNNLNEQIEYLLGYMYHRSNNDAYKKAVVDHFHGLIAQFYNNFTLLLEHVDDDNGKQLQDYVEKFCYSFYQEINNFSNVDQDKNATKRNIRRNIYD